eukprot:Partr_v1_DN25592_c1_g1_i2_m20717 putative Twinfilin, actin-binding protein, homolog
MSHSTGFPVSEELRSSFTSGDFRALFIQIIDQERLELVSKAPIKSSKWEDDYGVVASTITSKTEPYFVIFQLTTGSFMLLSYVPDEAAVRLKMLYSSTKATLSKQLGDSLFTDALYANQLSDLTLQAYQKHVLSKSSTTQPLTQREIDLNQIKMSELNADISVSTKRSFNNGISLEFSGSSASELEQFSRTAKECLIVSVNDKEAFVTETAPDYHSMVSKLPNDAPRFCLFNSFDTSETAASKTVFLYICPGASRVRDRMMYSASRHCLIAFVEKSVEIDVKCELSEVSELTEAFVHEKCGFVDSGAATGFHKEESVATSGFIKKVSRPGAGPRRLVKALD